MIELFTSIKFKTVVNLSLSDIHNNNGDVNKTVKDKLIDKFEGKCSKHGYIKKDSLVMIKRSGGTYIKEHFNGSIRYDVICNGKVCNPPKMSRLYCKLVSSNKMGYVGEVNDDNDNVIMEVIIPLQTAGISHEYDISNLSIGDDIMFECRGKDYQTHYKQIVIIGRVVKDDKIENDQIKAGDGNHNIDPEINDEVISLNDNEEDINDVYGGDLSDNENIKELNLESDGEGEYGGKDEDGDDDDDENDQDDDDDGDDDDDDDEDDDDRDGDDRDVDDNDDGNDDDGDEDDE